MINAVGTTALLVAALRAEETKRKDRLFEDPLAERLAGEAGHHVRAKYQAAAGPSVPIIEVRTRYFDQALQNAYESGIRQIVILAAGMDARAYRMGWPAELRLFELDQPAIIAYKAKLLAEEPCSCTRVAIAADLAEDFAPQLRAQGFDGDSQAAWLVEGLTQYLEAASVEALFARIDALSAPGSVLLYDMLGRSILESPKFTSTLAMMKELGAPWLYGNDDPGSLVTSRGWDAVVEDPAVIGNRWQRWPFKAPPPGIPGIPRGYFVKATKR